MSEITNIEEVKQKLHQFLNENEEIVEVVKEDSKFSLSLTRMNRSGMNFDERENFRILEGEVFILSVGQSTDNHGYVEDVLVITLSKTVIIYLWRDLSYNDINDE
ncbi:MAG: hypothetical protein ACTSPI_10170, partial [Candidatus Heimdallarchaeaceae archaeon]